ncbi:MAG: helicase-related protein [Candidatus Thermoplasmatota archaeon]
MSVEHQLIRPGSVEERDYQVNIARAALTESTLVVLPTGMGKTVVALIVIAETLAKTDGKVLLMAPTKPLVEQHSKFLREHLLGHEPVMFTGEVSPSKREDLWGSGRVVVSTPQVIENDLAEGRISLKGVSLIVFDEAHRAVGDYAYVSIGKRFSESGGLALGMTASPGSDVSKIAEVCENLGMTNVEIRSELDEDVVKYTQDVKTEFIGVSMPEEMGRVIYLLQRILDDQVAKLRAQGYLDPKKPPTTRDLLEAGRVIRAKLDAGTKNFHLFQTASANSLAMKINHGIELAQTQGKGALEGYFDKLVKQGQEKGGPKASRDLVKDARFQQARTLLYGQQREHPKLEKIVPILKGQFATKPDSRAIVFTHYRDTCDLLTQKLASVEGLRPVRFVGQSSRGEDVGLNQREQKEIIDRFRAGEHNVLVATSIAEEGLDIPTTDLVVFYEPVPSEIRTIQRRGRTGRRQAGRVVMFVTRDTKDEAYFWSSRKKEMQMRRELDALKRKLRARRGLPEEPRRKEALTRVQLEDMLTPEAPNAREELAQKTAEQRGQKSLGEFKGGAALAVSGRVARSGLAGALAAEGFAPREEELEAADIVVSGRVAVAFRTVEGFISDVNDGSMMAALAKLRQAYIHPVLIVQGEAEGRGSQEGNSAVYDYLSSLLSEFRMTVLSTNDAAQTASAVASMHSQEEARGRAGRGTQTTLDHAGRQMFLVQGLPNVSATLAERLLRRFGSVKGVADASVDELMGVEGIGKVIAEGIHTTMRRKFEEG